MNLFLFRQKLHVNFSLTVTVKQFQASNLEVPARGLQTADSRLVDAEASC